MPVVVKLYVGAVIAAGAWGQNLMLHPHVHCVIPAGGLPPDERRWVHSRYRFFLPVKVLGRVYRGKFVAGLKRAYRAGKLRLPGALKTLQKEKAFRAFLRSLFHQDWVVYAKPAFGGPKSVLRYLGRYTHRVAISNHRPLAFDGERVQFLWKDYARGGRRRRLTLRAEEFLRRFVRIRYFGFLVNRWRTTALHLCRRLLEAEASVASAARASPSAASTWPCPRCGTAMVVRKRLTAQELAARCAFLDSS